MSVENRDSHPLPEHPVLAQAAQALEVSGNWGFLCDDQWRFVYVTDELRHMLGAPQGLGQWCLGHVSGSPEYVRDAKTWLGGGYTVEQLGESIAIVVPHMLADLPGGGSTPAIVIPGARHGPECGAGRSVRGSRLDLAINLGPGRNRPPDAAAIERCRVVAAVRNSCDPLGRASAVSNVDAPLAASSGGILP